LVAASTPPTLFFSLTTNTSTDTGTTNGASVTDGSTSTKAAWCDSPWCYVDPCGCDAADVGQSTYISSEIAYSYATCGAVDTYTEAETSLAVGNYKCEGGQVNAASSRGFLMMVRVFVASMLISH